MPENKEVRKLELCDIAPYAPFDLIVHSSYNNRKERVIGLSRDQVACVIAESSNPVVWDWKYEDIKPYLRPLDQLTQEITHNGEKVNVGKIIEEECLSMDVRWLIVNDPSEISWRCYKILIKYHFDVFGLLSSGLAIPIHNTK